MSDKAASIAAFGAGFFAVIWLGLHNVLFNRFSRAGCHTATQDCTTPLNNHGYISFITSRQSLLLQTLWIAFILFAIGAALLAATSGFGRRNR
jgi:hypothetical protein